ncbi:hypothetical protein EIP86_000912 [Pleurotus ostreatoroseus]|nr:hypothetical protein EIP86_000912 [Pleurotus ostreatoroseus]
MGWDFDFAFMPYGDVWREHRKMFTQQYNAQAIVKYHNRFIRAVHGALARILEQPDDYMAHFRAMAASTVMSITYGITPLLKDDPYIAVAEDALAGLVCAGNPGTYFVKYIPKWFPGAGFKRQAALWRRSTREMINRPFITTKRNMV